MEIYLALIGLALSFFFAGSEAAYTAFNKLRLEVWRKQDRRFTKTASMFVNHPENFFSTILIGNNVSNILYTTFATVFLVAYIDKTLAWVIITFLVLFWGEIFPKYLLRMLANVVILQVLLLVRFFHILFKPVSGTINYLIDRFLNFLGINHEAVSEFFSREELELLIAEGFGSAASERPEQKYIANVLEFSGAKVREAMTPRTEMVAAPDTVSWDALLELMINSEKKYVLIYHESLDNVRGMVFAYDMFRQVDDIGSFIQPIRYVPENKTCAELLNEFQRDNLSVAVVIDEYGGTEGLVTTDDLIEEVIGQFQQDTEIKPRIKKLNDHTWLLDARFDLDELEELVNIRFREGEFETLAGLILHKEGRIPSIGETIVFNKFRVQIIKATAKQIKQVRLVKYIEG